MNTRCENSLQTLTRWLGSLLSAFALVAFVAVAIYGTLWLTINMVVAVVVMVGGVIQSIRANKTGEKPLVTDRCLYVVFYLFGLPITFLLFGLVTACGEDVVGYALAAYRIVVMFTACIVLREFLLPLLMRRSSRGVHTGIAVLLAVVMWPLYGSVLHKLGLPVAIYDLANSAFSSI
jgi:hypothetical protein